MWRISSDEAEVMDRPSEWVVVDILRRRYGIDPDSIHRIDITYEHRSWWVVVDDERYQVEDDESLRTFCVYEGGPIGDRYILEEV